MNRSKDQILRLSTKDISPWIPRVSAMEKLLKVLKKNKPVSIVVHNNPDPDALASATVLRFILKKEGYKGVRIFYDGLIGRAENQAMIKHLKIPLSQTKKMTSPKKRQFILVDCQPFTGNVTLPPDIKPIASIDHHREQRKTTQLPYFDIRPHYGSCSTIIYEYYSFFESSLPRDIATALFYAIFSETQGLGREGSEADKEAYFKLLPQISFSQLSKIQLPALSKDFIANLFRVLLNTFYYKNLAGVILDQLPYPDFVAEMADFLLRIKNISWSICMGSYKSQLLISVRTKNIHGNASKIIKKIIPPYGTAGGHDMIAGAQVKIKDEDKKKVMSIKKNILRKMLKELKHTHVHNLFKLITNEEFHLL